MSANSQPDSLVPFFIRAACETPVQETLRSALARVHRYGSYGFVDTGEGGGKVASVCGFPMYPDTSDLALEQAANLVLHQMSRGTGDEPDLEPYDYPDLIKTLECFLGGCSFTDAHVCGFIEEAYRRAGSSLAAWLIPAVPVTIPLN